MRGTRLGVPSPTWVAPETPIALGALLGGGVVACMRDSRGLLLPNLSAPALIRRRLGRRKETRGTPSSPSILPPFHTRTPKAP